MRLIVRKVYRAFPELDRFSDAECEGLLGLVARRHRAGRVVMSVALAVVGGIVFVFGCVVTAVVGDALMKSNQTRAFVEDGRYMVAGIVASVTAAVLFTSVCRTAWLRSQIHQHLSTLECTECEYSLLGLPVEGGTITCPECGQRFDLAARGLTAADVMASASSTTAL